MCILSNFIVFFKLIKVHFLVTELYIYQNAQYNDTNKGTYVFTHKKETHKTNFFNSTNNFPHTDKESSFKIAD